MVPRRRLLLCPVLLCLSLPALADIYKYYDKDGNLVLSDTVPKQDVEKVEKLPARPVMTVPAVPVDRRSRPVGAAGKDSRQAKDYALVIQSPLDGASYHQGGEPIPVALGVTPGLAAGHRVEMLLDDVVTASLTQIDAGQLEPGSHVFQVRVVDAQGKTLKSGSAGFHVEPAAAAAAAGLQLGN